MEKKRVGLFTPPIEKAGLIPLSNFIDLLSTVSDNISIISGNERLSLIKRPNVGHYAFLSHTTGKNSFSRILKFLFLQIKISIYFIKFNKYVDCWFFFLGGENDIIPLIIARLLKKPVFCMLTSSVPQMSFYDRYNFFIKYSTRMGYVLANKIIVYSPRLISEWHLESHHHKILIAHRHFLDFDKYNVTTAFSGRPMLIGYIGRINEEKGIHHFVQALPAIIRTKKDLHILIVGVGPLTESIELFLQAEKLTDRVDLPGWISHNDLPHYLNQLRLLVLPSYTEGLPNIMLEAMACGTPLLATPVGAIPDVIRDGETGFIMENNFPDCIAENVIRALNSPDMERIAERGRRFVEENYTFENAVNIWAQLFEEI